MSTTLERAPTALSPHLTYHDLTLLLASLEKRLCGSPWADPMVPSLLDSLVLHLEAHLETDLGAGFEELGEEEPRLAAPIESLVQEGFVLVFRAKDLASRGHRQPHIRSTWVALRKSLQDLRKAIEKQESAERELLNEAYQRDIGARD